MTTKAEMVTILKAENPSLKVGSDETGYTDLTPADYEAQISEWADNRLAKEAEAAREVAEAKAKAFILAKLGITAEEAQLLLA